MAANDTLRNQYLGCILGAAAGDALGAATECKSTRQIIAAFGGRVTDFKTPPDDCMARGRAKGQVTDAFSIPYVLSQHLLVSGGQVSRRLAEEALVEWGKSEWFLPFAGMTTRKVVNRLNQDNSQELWAYSGHLGNKLFKGHYYALSSNGAAVKAYPAALLHPGDPESAVRDVVELTMASHDDPLSISGAGAVAAAVATALGKNATVYSMTQAAVKGAALGEKLARKREDIWIYPGPSVQDRLEMAIEEALQNEGKDAMGAIGALIGSGPAIAETVPAAFGLLIAREGDIMASLYDAVNIGDETAAIASLVGALGGALKGVNAFPTHYLPAIDRANGFDLAAHADAWIKMIDNVL
jgi:ADP-ribosylglycohydrolase